MKSGNLNFLEPSGPLQACNGTALPFFIIDLTGEWRGMHDNELHDIFSSPDIVRLVSSRRMEWLWLVAHIREKKHR
jgi:hypothetical protein